MTVSVPLLVSLAAGLLLGLSLWSARQNRARLLARLQAEWGQPRDRPRDLGSIADLSLTEAAPGATLDDRTWNDLLLDDVFAHLDRTESAIGQQVLYRRLRATPRAANLEAFDVLAELMTRDAERRERAQTTLSRLKDSSAYLVHRLGRPGALVRRVWHLLIPVWTAVVVASAAAAFIWPVFVPAAVLGLLVNFGIRIGTGRRVGAEVTSFRQVGPLLAAATELARLTGREAGALTASLEEDLAALKRLGTIARLVGRDPVALGELAGAVMEYLNIALLLDANALYFAGRELRTHGSRLTKVIGAVGEIDAAISVASFRQGAGVWARPAFGESKDGTIFSDVRHPLLREAVPNSVGLAPPHGLLVTGSNMSGKSTFLRTIGLNVVLAQTIATSLARTYRAPVYHVQSCIGRADDLVAGKSYYQVEVESVLALVRASLTDTPHLFLFDELFRGTNAVERIAAAEAVLAALIASGKPHVVIAATHDGELVDLLRARYDVCHFGDAIGPDGLSFDYKLTPGPATSRNAIQLLKLSGAPDAIIDSALARAAELDRQRVRTDASTQRRGDG